MGNWVFLNKDFVTEENAVLNFRDLSIQRGYGVFDFFKVINSFPVFLEEHLNRFYFSAEQMRLKLTYTKDEIRKIIFELLQRNKATDTGVKITLTGGYSVDGYQLSTPNLIISLHPFSPPTKEQFEKGIRLITYEHQRQLPHIKTIDYLMGIWLQPFLQKNNADDVLYHRNGIVTECPRSNFFIVTNDNKIVTASKNILNGIERTKLIEMAKTKFEIEERELTINEIKTAKEAFITSTTKTVLPVRQIDEYVFTSPSTVATECYQILSSASHKH
jgi:D-alanine transaminase/branched-chain amino acid aminotransferase